MRAIGKEMRQRLVYQHHFSSAFPTAVLLGIYWLNKRTSSKNLISQTVYFKTLLQVPG